ncbi:hypothetical protein [Sinorhizobium sp. GL28]|uniref:hypothetical protein n=1 Tax=Sinorhizobium sp. GL28 TaxID=1358418 RepID=UPI00071E2563|nr:hypothetical protein [Sinorhizobium sp. GL28]KSV92886.1 hypothetical protein N184_22315 [Sinorhizobium sp. GL28]
MLRSSFAGSAFALACIYASTSFAATKAMECERYQVGSDNFKTERFVYTVKADLDAGSLKIDLTTEPKENKSGKFPIPAVPDWKVIWRSQDSLRVVGLKTDYATNPFDSPVMMIDVDFANVRMAYATAGGLVDFDTVVTDPWKYECKRLD